MSAGLFGLLDDVAAIAKMAAASVDDVSAAAAKASAKAAGVVVDDTAVTPQYVHGVDASRELPIVKQIAVGSIRNKLFIILPVALLLSQFAEWLITPVLMMGGTYLAFEGVEKIWARISGHDHHDVPVTEQGPEAEKKLISGAIRTDLILSTEIMVISLNEVAEESFWLRLGALVAVAFVITAVVYGVVALIVKMDDVGLRLASAGSALRRGLGRRLVAAMPRLLSAISVIGIAAMIWVGGHILLSGADDLGWHGPYGLVHDLEDEIEHAFDTLGPALAWCVNTLCSAVVGLIVGAVAVTVVHLVGVLRGRSAHAGN
ncbi:MAG: DUF808 domain-containing protein [Nocardioides sp.]